MPVKFLEVYFIATGNWFGTIVTLVLAKLLGLGVTAFVVDATRDKLLQIPGSTGCMTGSSGRLTGLIRKN
jgi:hypothetical protein